MKKMKKGFFYKKTEEKAGLLDEKERRVERKWEKNGGKMMTWLILIGIMVFVGFVVRATLGVIGGSGSMDWAALDDDDDVSAWGDDDWLDDDIITSPVYSFLACNIWHDPFEDDFTWSSSDDDWMWDNDDD